VGDEDGCREYIMTVEWDQELGAVRRDVASRGHVPELRAARQSGEEMPLISREIRLHGHDVRESVGQLVGREYAGSMCVIFTPGPDAEAVTIDTHLTFSYSTHSSSSTSTGSSDVWCGSRRWPAINPRCAATDGGRRPHGLGYALSETFTSTNGRPTLLLRDSAS